MYQALDPAALQALLSSEDPPSLIDVRGGAEVARGMIPGARNIELGTLPVRVNEFDPDAPLVLYCLSGARSAQGCTWLAQRGFRRLHHLHGGFAAWMKAGFPVVNA